VTREAKGRIRGTWGRNNVKGPGIPLRVVEKPKKKTSGGGDEEENPTSYLATALNSLEREKGAWGGISGGSDSSN